MANGILPLLARRAFIASVGQPRGPAVTLQVPVHSSRAAAAVVTSSASIPSRPAWARTGRGYNAGGLGLTAGLWHICFLLEDLSFRHRFLPANSRNQESYDTVRYRNVAGKIETPFVRQDLLPPTPKSPGRLLNAMTATPLSYSDPAIILSLILLEVRDTAPVRLSSN
ncbi:uncharacterized protein PG986_010110 [Apiospora aurea]|uniref:Uncharacterized protein n=1 Tax=Apiospora aurea TaxID=335848 RepID=A0ABR1Q9N4_9PEZI